ncbi:hypothetical protein VE00_10869 [Pseudogymnoascus sp. WSF 3629]|nr:hypothetical protein VE00_10869 [Pseudogymnoascus sp. WSF 3629]
MKVLLNKILLPLVALLPLALGDCISSGDQNTINNALAAGGSKTIVQLCASALIQVTGQITFTAANQEISTAGYPTGSTRATLQIAPGSTVSTIIAGGNHNGVRILNIQIDGNRANTGYDHTGGANIELGGSGSGQVVSHVASKNPRGWSCLHVIGSGNAAAPCTNATIVNNDIGPCGQSGTDSAANGLWADGISLDCTKSLVQDNTITGSTDGGIVIFGSPGSTITGNTIISSATYLGFGAINMVDGEYSGSYAGVTVSNNKIVGQKMFNLGIGIGSNVWSFNDPYMLQGPVSITGNTISGSVSFPIAINGWTNGITVSGNSVSGVTSPKSSFADASHCSQAIQTLFNENTDLIYYLPGVTGTQSLQSGFVAASSNVTNFLCSTLPLPNSVSYTKNSLNIVSDSAPFANLHGVVMQYQGDNNVVVYTTTNGETVVWASGHTLSSGCGSPSLCRMSFQGDGNLVTYYNNVPRWSSGTSGTGNTMVCLNKAPWIQILDTSGNVIWDTTKSV